MSLSLGDMVPDVLMVDHDGRSWKLSSYRGRPVVLVLHRHLA